MQHRFFEDWAPGDTLDTGTSTISRESVLAFAREYDPQPFHLEDEAARVSLFGRLAASGWQTASTTMRLMVDTGTLSGVGVGLGVDELRWHKPVYPGDTLRAVIECIDARARPEKPNGVVRYQITTYNQHDEKVMSHVASVLVNKRTSP